MFHFLNQTDTIKKPYLIQTWKLQENQNHNGLDNRFHGHFYPDYMGSAEFEFGSIQDCMEYIIEHLDEYQTIYSNGRFYWIGPKKKLVNDYGVFIDAMQNRKIFPKDFVFTYAKDKRGNPTFGTNVMRSELGMDVENAILFSEKRYILEIALKALQFNKDNPLNIRVHRWFEGGYEKYPQYYHEAMVTDEFLREQYPGDQIRVERKIDASDEWITIKELVIPELTSNMRVDVDYLDGTTDRWFDNIINIQKAREQAVALRFKFKRFQIFELKNDAWISVYDWKK